MACEARPAQMPLMPLGRKAGPESPDEKNQEDQAKVGICSYKD